MDANKLSNNINYKQDYTHDAFTRFASTASLYGNDINVIAVPHTFGPQLRLNCLASLTASQLGLQSVDYARNKYCSHLDLSVDNDDLALILKTSLTQVDSSRRQMLESDVKIPSHGSLSALFGLIRLSSTFASSSLLFRFGMMLEARALARMVIEQIAWAYAIDGLDELEVNSFKSQLSIGKLKRFIPHSARAYGVLSKAIHLSPPLDRYYVEVDQTEDGDVFSVRNRDSRDSCTQSSVILIILADMYSIVSDFLLKDKLGEFESIEMASDSSVCIKHDRPFRQIVDKYTQRYWDRTITEC